MGDLDDQLDLLRCPETGARLEWIDAETVEKLNEQLRRGTLRDISGEPVREPLESGLQPVGASFVYPVRGGIPNFLLADRLLLAELPQ